MAGFTVTCWYNVLFTGTAWYRLVCQDAVTCFHQRCSFAKTFGLIATQLLWLSSQLQSLETFFISWLDRCIKEDFWTIETNRGKVPSISISILVDFALWQIIVIWWFCNWIMWLILEDPSWGGIHRTWGWCLANKEWIKIDGSASSPNGSSLRILRPHNDKKKSLQQKKK